MEVSIWVNACACLCTYMCMDILFSYPNIFISKRNQQWQKSGRKGRAGSCCQPVGKSYLDLHEPRTLLALSLTAAAKHNDHCKREQSAVSSKPFNAFWLWHCTNVKQVWGAHIQLFRFVSSVQTEELGRVAELLSRVSYVNRWQDFCYTGKL